MRLDLDHLILRAGDPAATLAELAARAGSPVLAEVEEVGGLASGIARAGALDLEVLRIGREPPPRPFGYGIGFVADVPLEAAVAELRALGFPTSPPARAVAGEEGERRTWRAVQVRGLLPNPFPAPASTRAPGWADRGAAAAAGLAMRIPALARMAMREAGDSMVVVTEYEFDMAGWRGSVDPGPEVVAVEVGAGECAGAWARLPLAASPLSVRDDGPAGVRRIVLGGPGEAFSLGDVRFEWAA